MPTIATMRPSGTAHIYLDERCRGWIDDTDIKVIEIVMDMRDPELGTPARIHEEFPNISLAQIHSAMAWYHDHQAEYDAEIERIRREYEAGLAAQQNSPIRQKLRNMGLIQ